VLTVEYVPKAVSIKVARKLLVYSESQGFEPNRRNKAQNNNKMQTESAHISSFIKIRSVGAELFQADGRTDGHDKANSRFLQFCERA
jgi:hypothetical protein